MSPRFAPSELFLKAQTDERLLALAGQGHGRAFAVMVERRRGALLAHAQRMVGPERAEDVVQQTLLRAWSSLQRGLEVRHAQAWLHRIVHNASLSEIERQVQGTEPLDEQLAGRGSVIGDAERRFEARQVLEGLASLPERQRLALLGTELEGRSRRELAAELGLSEGAVRQLVHRARAGVRAAVAVVVPLPLLTRLMKGAGWLPGPEAGGGLRPSVEAVTASSLMVGGAAKAGTALLAIGAVGGGLLLHGTRANPHGRAVAVMALHGAQRSGGHPHAGHLLLAAPPAASSAATAGAAAKPAAVRHGGSGSARLGAAGSRSLRERGAASRDGAVGAQQRAAVRRRAGEDGRAPATSSVQQVPSREDSGSPGWSSPPSSGGQDGATGSDGASQTSTTETGGWSAPQTLSSSSGSNRGGLPSAGGSDAGASEPSAGTASDAAGGVNAGESPSAPAAAGTSD